MFFKKVLVLHAEKGLVRAGTPNLTLFHQATTIIDITIDVTIVTIAIAVTSVFIVSMAMTSVTIRMKCTVTFIPTAVLGCCLFF